MSKARELARQVTRTNEQFLSTKILDRSAVFNVFSQNLRHSRKQNPIDENTAGETGLVPDGSAEDDNAAGPVTPFTRYSHHDGHSFEAAGRIRVFHADHAALVRGEGGWFLMLSGYFNVIGYRKS